MKSLIVTLSFVFVSAAARATPPQPEAKDTSGQYTIKDVQISFEGGDDNEAPPVLKAEGPAPKKKSDKKKKSAKKPAASPAPKK